MKKLLVYFFAIMLVASMAYNVYAQCPNSGKHQGMGQGKGQGQGHGMGQGNGCKGKESKESKDKCDGCKGDCKGDCDKCKGDCDKCKGDCDKCKGDCDGKAKGHRKAMNENPLEELAKKLENAMKRLKDFFKKAQKSIKKLRELLKQLEDGARPQPEPDPKPVKPRPEPVKPHPDPFPKPVKPEPVRPEMPKKGWLGAKIVELDEASRDMLGTGNVGLMVKETVADGPADGRLKEFDVLLEANGTKLSQNSDLGKMLAGMKAGDKVDFLIMRNGEKTHVTVVLGAKGRKIAEPVRPEDKDKPTTDPVSPENADQVRRALEKFYEEGDKTDPNPPKGMFDGLEGMEGLKDLFKPGEDGKGPDMKELMKQLMGNKKPDKPKPDPTRKPRLGISAANPSDDMRLNGEFGVMVTNVAEDSCAHKGGLKAGDRIVRFDGTTITAKSDLLDVLRSKMAGDKVEIVVIRDGKKLTLTVVLDNAIK